MSEFDSTGHESYFRNEKGQWDLEGSVHHGVLRVKYLTMQDDATGSVLSQKGIQVGDRYIELHFAPQDKTPKEQEMVAAKKLLEEMRESMVLLASEIRKRGLENAMVMGGTTNEGLANLAQRVGFEVEEAFLPDPKTGLHNLHLLDELIGEKKEPSSPVLSKLFPQQRNDKHFVVSMKASDLVERFPERVTPQVV
ncbi:MAG: hypothetical protein HY430_00210 [Candidatus Levybacteria bacterium]|nr:hypothetical protein [Candidatus Levybacteria bacterium]